MPEQREVAIMIVSELVAGDRSEYMIGTRVAQSVCLRDRTFAEGNPVFHTDPQFLLEKDNQRGDQPWAQC